MEILQIFAYFQGTDRLLLKLILKISIPLGVEKIDTNRLKNILERSVLEYLSNLESSPHDAISFLVIGDVLYGNTPEDVGRG